MVGPARQANRIDIIGCLDLALAVDLSGVRMDEAQTVANHDIPHHSQPKPINAPGDNAFKLRSIAALAQKVRRG
jgi:hypothetical protein